MRNWYTKTGIKISKQEFTKKTKKKKNKEPIWKAGSEVIKNSTYEANSRLLGFQEVADELKTTSQSDSEFRQKNKTKKIVCLSI